MNITISDFMKVRYNLMIYVGIDIAKLNHFTAMVSLESEILIEPMYKNNVCKTKTDNVNFLIFSHSKSTFSPL